MICTTIQNRDFSRIMEILPECEMAEIRLDSCPLSDAEIDECFSSDVPLVATCRIDVLLRVEPSLQVEGLSASSREIRAAAIAEKRLCKAIEAGARYVDVEMGAPKPMSKRVRECAHENGTVFIRSYHNFESTDADLDAIVEKCLYHGADLAKVATMASSPQDVERVMSLYGRYGRNGRLVAFCMGETGKMSRMECLRLGAPFTYAALCAEEAAAPGQREAALMKKELYGGFSFGDRPLADTASFEEVPVIKMPVSKSYSQRAIIAAALADGVSHLNGYSPCADSEAALDVAEKLGAEVIRNGKSLTITGIGAKAGSIALSELFVGESGLLTRMMIPVAAQISSGDVVIRGEKTLLSRPLAGAAGIMSAFGVVLEPAPDSDGNGVASASDRERACDASCMKGEESEKIVKVPLRVCGELSCGKADISGKNGSQLISGLLMALPMGARNSTLTVHEPKSIPYMFITLEVLKKFGVKVSNEMLGGRDFLESDGDWSLCSELVFKIKGGQSFKAADIDLEGDWSAAANFLVAGAVFGKVEVGGLDTTSLQADLSIMDILMDAGASLSQLDGNLGTITAQRAPLSAFEVDASNCPDLFPIVSVLAAFCAGKSRIAGLGRLANKESDRAGAILEMLSNMGVKAYSDGDVLVVEGYTLAQRFLGADGCGLLKGGRYTSHHDHRMAMALTVAGIGADSPIEIDDTDCVSKSFPDFFNVFKSML